jgi:hypothetical protein
MVQTRNKCGGMKTVAKLFLKPFSQPGKRNRNKNGFYRNRLRTEMIGALIDSRGSTVDWTSSSTMGLHPCLVPELTQLRFI